MARILVVDDEKTERECVRFLIEQSGLPLEVSEAGDGREALRRLKETDGADIRRISVNEKSEAFRVLRCESGEKQISLLFIMKYVP